MSIRFYLVFSHLNFNRSNKCNRGNLSSHLTMVSTSIGNRHQDLRSEVWSLCGVEWLHEPWLLSGNIAFKSLWWVLRLLCRIEGNQATSRYESKLMGRYLASIIKLISWLITGDLPSNNEISTNGKPSIANIIS